MVRSRGFRDGAVVSYTWFDPPFRPEPPHTNQAYGICSTGDGMIVLDGYSVRDGGRHWNLLGGGVELLAWDPRYEVDERRLVRPDEFLEVLTWGRSPTAAFILEAGLRA